MRAILAVFCILGACASCVSEFSGRPGQSPSDQYNSVVKVTVACLDETTPTLYGSGFVVSSSEVVTALHVVTCAIGKPTIWVDPGDGDQRAAVVDVSLPASDVVRLRVNADLSRWFTPVRVGPEPSVGDRVCWVGVVPVAHRRCGDITPSHHHGFLWVSGVIIHGMSGGPVFDSSGRVIGVVHATFNCEGAGFCLGEISPVVGKHWLVEE